MRRNQRNLIVALIISIIVLWFAPSKASLVSSNHRIINFKLDWRNFSKEFRDTIMIGEYEGEGVDYSTPIPQGMSKEAMQKAVTGEISLEEAEAPYLKY